MPLSIYRFPSPSQQLITVISKVGIHNPSLIDVYFMQLSVKHIIRINMFILGYDEVSPPLKLTERVNNEH